MTKMTEETERQFQQIEDAIGRLRTAIIALDVHVGLLAGTGGLDDELVDAIEQRCGKLGVQLEWKGMMP